MATDYTQQIQDQEDHIAKLQELFNQVNAKQMTPYQQVNKLASHQFEEARRRKIQEIRDSFNASQRTLATLKKSAEKGTPAGEKPMTEAQSLAAADRKAKREGDLESQGPQKRLAESQLEQQKAADAASIPALGASVPTKEGGAKGLSLRDLITNFQMKPDRQAGEYVFSRPNDEGVLTPGQTRANAQLTNALKSSGLQPEQVFGVGVPYPTFDPKTGISTGVGNPFIGKKADYDQLAAIYKQAQPNENTEVRVPTGTLDRAYQAAAPAYGPTFPANPADIDRKTPAAVALAGMGKPGEEGYIPPSADTATFMALRRGQADAVGDELGRPITLNVTDANPMTPAAGPVQGPAPAPVMGPQPPTPDEKLSAAKAALSSTARQTGVPEEILSGIVARTDDPAIQKRAIDDERARISGEKLGGQSLDVAGTAFKYGTIPGLYGTALDKLRGLDLYSTERQAEELRLQEESRRARGLDPLPDEAPAVDYQPGA